MNITIFGTGYVGLVTGACLAEVGHVILCIDIDQIRVAELSQGNVSIYEPGLTELVQKNIQAKRLSFTADAYEGVQHGSVQFIAVGTPSSHDGAADLSAVLKVAETIAVHMQDDQLIVTKSTAPVGTGDKLQQLVHDVLLRRNVNFDYSIACNPEFLKEGSAVNDFMRPDRIILGVQEVESEKTLRTIYQPFTRNHDRVISMDRRSAELTKYAANCLLATKISFINEIANIADQMGADIEKVRIGVGADHRIGYDFIYPGCGYGGSCFPKDVRALIYTAKNHAYQPKLLQAVNQVNEQQKHYLFKKITSYFSGKLADKCFALWGLAFKPNTDDTREASSLVLIDELLQAGAKIQCYDPVAMDNVKALYAEEECLQFCQDKETALVDADALVICTEWQDFRMPDFSFIKNTLKQAVIFDGRNMFDSEALCNAGISYYSVGRSPILSRTKKTVSTVSE